MAVIAGAAVVALGLGAWLLADGDDSPDDLEVVEASDHDRGRSPRGRAKEKRRADVERRVAALEDQVAALQRELAKQRMVRGGSIARGLTDTPSDEAEADAPAFEGAVRDIIETEREEARERRGDAMRDRFTERHNEILDELVAVAGLNTSERESIQSLWETESEQLIPMFMAAREGERPFSEVREEADKLRSTTDTEVEGMLTAEQYAQYQEMRPGPPGRGRRGGERRGPPPG